MSTSVKKFLKVKVIVLSWFPSNKKVNKTVLDLCLADTETFLNDNSV